VARYPDRPVTDHDAPGRHAEVRVEQRPRARAGSALIEVVVVIILALGLSALIKTFLVQSFFIPSGSMENTLLVGDRILVEKITPRFGQVHRGDVVVFTDPGGWLGTTAVTQPTSGVSQLAHDVLVGIGVLPQDTEGDLVKRVIGVGGDTVSCCTDSGRITVNGTPLREPYLYPGNSPSAQPFSVTVPAGMLWVMGDHRAVSQDSRAHQQDAHGGMVPVRDVVGRVFVIIWPWDRAGGVGRPSTFSAVP